MAGKDRDAWAVWALIIMLAIGLLAWGLIPYAVGFKQGVYP